jgi:predicted DNA-binding ribbon-helix-helix protein
MCRVFAGQDPRNYESVTRSVRLSGYSTSIRLERLFWSVLEEIAGSEGMTTPQFMARLHDEVLDQQGEVRNFASLLRCACLIHTARRENSGLPLAAE